MILLDTNVVSEPLKPIPDPGVMAWLDAQIIETLYLSTTALAEILTGIEGMPHGRRRQIAESTVKLHVNALFEKLGVKSRTEAMRAGLERALIRLR